MSEVKNKQLKTRICNALMEGLTVGGSALNVFSYLEHDSRITGMQDPLGNPRPLWGRRALLSLATTFNHPTVIWSEDQTLPENTGINHFSVSARKQRTWLYLEIYISTLSGLNPAYCYHAVSLLLQTGIGGCLLQLNSKDESGRQCASILGVKAPKSQAWFGNTRTLWTGSLQSLQFTGAGVFPSVLFPVHTCVIVCESHLCFLATNQNASCPLGFVYPDSSPIQPLGDLEESECKPGFNSMPSTRFFFFF